MARTSLFAHLLSSAGLTAAAKRAAEDDADDTTMIDDVEDDDTPGMADNDDTDGDEPKGKKAKGKKAKAAAEDDDDGDADDDDDKPDAKAKAARAAGMKAGAAAERARCRAIFAAKEAAGRPDMAAQLAFETSLTADEAIGVLRTGPQAANTGLGDRMARLDIPNPGGGADAGPGSGAKPSLAARMLAVGKKTGTLVTD